GGWGGSPSPPAPSPRRTPPPPRHSTSAGSSSRWRGDRSGRWSPASLPARPWGWGARVVGWVRCPGSFRSSSLHRLAPPSPEVGEPMPRADRPEPRVFERLAVAYRARPPYPEALVDPRSALARRGPL